MLPVYLLNFTPSERQQILSVTPYHSSMMFQSAFDFSTLNNLKHFYVCIYRISENCLS